MNCLVGSVVGVVIIFVTLLSDSHSVEVNYRLPKDVVPDSYNITIRPYFLPEDGKKRYTFDGETSIIIFNTKNSSVHEFAIHANNLDFIKIDLYSLVGGRVNFSYEYEVLTDRLIFRLKENLVPFGKYSLNFRFIGRVFDGYEGLFRSSYIDAEGYERVILATQLQRINARKLFPCFDEPGFKAFFNLHISRPKNSKSFSNTALLSTTVDKNENHRYIDHFKTTPYMSTYLVAIMISEYVPRRLGQDTIYIISRPEFYNKTIFSYQVANIILNGYDQLLGVPYAALGNDILQKTSLPSFVHNGMENWGLTIYKDEVLIFEDNNTDIYGLQYATTIISHETSHNWFGNSMTFEWWGYFWLNEAFARYYQYFLTQELFPQYELDKQFTVDQMHSIFDTDAVNSTQPLSEPNVASPTEIAKKFSSITYVKGSSVIRMISHAMSESNFQLAIRDYISQNMKGSVNPSHLLKHLTKYWPSTPNVDVKLFFSDWTEQVGFPLLNVVLSENNSKINIQQTRFLLNPNDGSDQSLRYTIPLTYTTDVERDFNKTYPILYFNKDQQQIVLSFKEPIQWIVFNIQQTGYYRVLYDTNLTNKLYNSLLQNNWSDIHESNRAQFVDDLFALGRIGLHKYDSVFNWLGYLQTETHFTPWKAAFKGFTFIGQFLTVKEHIGFGKYILSVTEKVFKKLSTKPVLDRESVLDVYNRNQVMNFNCKYRREECVTEVRRMLGDYLNNETMIPVDIRSAVYCNGMRDASEKDFEKLGKRFKLEKVPREKLRIRNGLACVRDSRNIESYFELVLGDDDVPVDEKIDALAPLYKENPENVSPVYEIITSRVGDVAKALGSWEKTAELVSKIATFLITIDQRNAFEEFIQRNNEIFGVSQSVLFDALRQIDHNLDWSKRHLEPLRKFLAINYS